MGVRYTKSIVWIRRDLRLFDHTALSRATSESESVAVVFIFDTEILKRLKNKRDMRITYIYESLRELDEKLRSHGSKLIVRQGNPIAEIPKLVQQFGAEALYFNEDYEPYAIRRDGKVRGTLEKKNVSVHSFKDHVIFSGGEILKPDGSPYKKYTPYKKRWLRTLRKKDFEVQKIRNRFFKSSGSSFRSKFLSLSDLGFEKANLHYSFQQPGRKNALKQLKKFTGCIVDYDKNRNFPSIDGTSGLSVHLRFGTLSVRECLRLSLQSKSLGYRAWLSEIVWRDFYQMILLQFPHVKNKSFDAKYREMAWVNSRKHFKAWCDGETGYPIVDSAMRQLNQTGWMHNRLRMIVASFLTKDLLVDWRKGESYFAERLLDFDLAANNGGWQWAASTGCDAQPYFRVFNPWLQSKKFDPDAKFIKEFVPELGQLSSSKIHEPILGHKVYPEPIVDHQQQKVKAVALYKR